ncbi:MAG TPA: alanine--tRNA ligase [Candidatus Eremiobacteraceae bacterium]|nr:alanine--tRNA ligase [Candidatus Eremiobacteraceae bacterium]
MTSQEIRRAFVDFFASKGHRHLPGASLVPDAMSTTLFTIAGMEPFVPVFLGDEPPPAPRVVTVQRCLRVAGGKNDIENVGRSGRHGTFLEMLGNFSFGDYYKRDAIRWAWEFLTSTLGIAPDRLYATVYVDDDEAADLWHRETGLDRARISRFKEDNFWDMGPTGPCGPCSEIFVDLGQEAGCGRADCAVGCAHCNRFIEVWNLVFQQYDRDSAGVMHPLPKKCIDTGMGFERLCMVMAGKVSIFDTDLYQDIIARLPSDGASALSPDERAVHRRIIADHARASVFLINDGVLPGNTDRGYVLRYLTRRAIRSGRLLGFESGFFSMLVPAVIASLVDGYPDLSGAGDRIARVLAAEERQFEQTLLRGMRRLGDALDALTSKGKKTLAGSDVFELHDTYGFPPELTAEIARDAGTEVDMAGYRAAMDEQRGRARRDAQAKRTEVRVAEASADAGLAGSEFVGYDSLEARARVLALFDASGSPVPSLDPGQEGVVALDRTPFYAERGGQMGDRGVLARAGSSFDVTDTQYRDKSHRHVLHKGAMREGHLAVGDTIDAFVDAAWRREIRRHHTVTHLLQRALKDVAGDGVAQRGSAVFPDRTRFDFDSPVGALHKEQRSQVAALVNDLIRADHHISVEVMPFAAATEHGAVFMQGERYGDMVRVVKFGPSIELCGGTHVGSTGEIGHFILLSEGAIGAGIRRVEGLVSAAADAYVNRVREAAEEAGSQLTATIEQLPETAARLARERRDLEKKIVTLQSQLAGTRAAEYLSQVQDVGGVRFLAVRAAADEGVNAKDLSDSIRTKFGSGVLAVAGGENGKLAVVVSVSPDLVKRGLSAKDVFAAIAPHVDAKGGGGQAMAQGAGKNGAGIEAGFAAVPPLIRAALRA